MSNTILVVEDEEVTRDILATWLEEAGYDTCTAGNGFEGLVEVKENSPDLVVTDIMMPQMDGYEACRRLKQDPSLRDIPVIFLTAKSQEREVKKGLSLGAVGYLIKPFNPMSLAEEIQQILGAEEETSS